MINQNAVSTYARLCSGLADLRLMGEVALIGAVESDSTSVRSSNRSRPAFSWLTGASA
jgi:hypothetical protein